jgi:hypothetical protein
MEKDNQAVGKEKRKTIAFSRYFLMANYKIQNELRDSVVREDEIYDWFIQKDNAALCDYANKPSSLCVKLSEMSNIIWLLWRDVAMMETRTLRWIT